MIAYASINISYILDCSYDSVIAPSDNSFYYTLGENQTFQIGKFTNLINLCNNSLSNVHGMSLSSQTIKSKKVLNYILKFALNFNHLPQIQTVKWLVDKN